MFPKLSRRLAKPVRALLLGLLYLLSPLARAHDPYETFMNVLVRPDRLELNVTMAQANALRLIDPQAKIHGLTPENFSQFRARLAREGESLLVFTSNRTALKPREVKVELTDELDVAYTILYPRPPPGQLHVHAAFLKKLGEGYGGICDISDAEDNHLGWDTLLWQNPHLEVTLADPAAKK